MRRGKAGRDELVALFAEDGEYTEPFSGTSRTHRGKAAIEACLSGGFDNPPPQLRLTVDRVDVDGPNVRAEWTCSSPAFDAPVRGLDEYTVQDGRIARLVTSLVRD